MEILKQFRENSQEVTSTKELRDLFSKSVKRAGYAGFDAYSIKPGSIESSSIDQPSNLFICDYGLDIMLPFITSGWIQMDPSMVKTSNTTTPYDYVKFLRESQANTSVKWQLGALRLKRINQAWLIPLNVVEHTRAVTVYMQGKGTLIDQKFNDTLDELTLMSNHFMEIFIRLSNVTELNNKAEPEKEINAGSISARETDCLHWAARGKTNWEIGELLKISENTVRFHLKNAFKKLDSNSRSRAVNRAIREGIIEL